MTALVDAPTADRTDSAPTPRTARRPRLALIALLATTAALYLWNLSASGYGNTFYAAAAEAGSKSWSAWFFGALDAQKFITVDKPAASLWVTGLSVRIFGMNPWAVLAPQALMGVATVALVYSTVRRAIADPRLSEAAGLLAGAVTALTPAAALMFRFNNPDALLVLLMTLGAYCVTRAVQCSASDSPPRVAKTAWRWLALAGVALGTAFLAKMLQGLLVLPAFGLSYLLLAATRWPKRIAHLLIAAASVVMSAGWWVLVVQLMPASARPYVGGSTNNSVLQLALGYNGMERIFGGETPGHAFGPADLHGPAPPSGPGISSGPLPPLRPGMGAAGSSFGGSPGWQRLFGSEMGYEISWLLPVAVFAVVFGLYLAARGRLSRDERAALLLWGGWLTVTAVVFSAMGGIVHPYYTVALAPTVGALVGLGGAWAWRIRDHLTGRLALAAMIALAAGWSLVLAHRAQFGPPWVHWLVAGVALAAALGVLMAGVVNRQRAVAVAVGVGAVAASAGTAAFSVATGATPHHGPIPNAVHTASAEMPDFPQGPGWPNDEDNTAVAALLATTSSEWSAATNGSVSAAGLEIASGTSVMAIGGFSGDPVPTLQQFIDYVHAGKITYYVADSHEGGPPGPAPTGNAQQIADWVAQHYTATMVGKTKVYRLI